MKNYLQLLQDVLDNGFAKDDRTGVGSISVWGRVLHWNLAEGFPIITTRKVSLRIAFEETMFFLRGERQTKLLEEKGINIWKGNTTREFLDKRGLHWLEEGDMGYGYSHQWRNFGGVDGSHSGVDQIRELVEGIRKDPFSRRHIVSAWNPQQVQYTPLPPCHILHQYQVTPDNKLNSSFLLRSNDVPFGLPYNIMGYALLNILFAKLLGYEPGTLVYMGNDVHIYKNQVDMVKEQLTREPFPLPKLIVKKELKTLEDLLSLEYTDLELVGYEAHPDIKDKPKMAV